MSNFLVCILACISVVRDKHDKNMASRKLMCSTGIPVGLLQISSDRDDRRFFGCEILNFGIFLGWKILISIFGKLDLSKDFFWYSKLSEDS